MATQMLTTIKITPTTTMMASVMTTTPVIKTTMRAIPARMVPGRGLDQPFPATARAFELGQAAHGFLDGGQGVVYHNRS